jgi:5'-deoxynucleotidase YfbR-like HD superfamily hydrolase
MAALQETGLHFEPQENTRPRPSLCRYERPTHDVSTEWKKVLEDTGIAERLRLVLREGHKKRMEAQQYSVEFILANCENVMAHSEDVESIVDKYWSYSGLPEETKPAAKVMALLHDIHEIVSGDITPYTGKKRPDYGKWEDRTPDQEDAKFRKELGAFNKVILMLPHNQQDFVRRIWLEYAHQETAVAVYVRDCDKFAAARKANEYVDKGIFLPAWMNAFKQEAHKKIHNAALKKMVIAGSFNPSETILPTLH